MIKDLIDTEGPITSQVFMIKQKTRALSNAGSAYLALTLQDNSGTIEARKWGIDDYDEEVCEAGKLIRISGLVQIYKEHPQIKITDLEGVSESEVDITRFIPSAPVKLDILKKQLNSYVNMIQDDELRKVTFSLIQENYEKYTTYPAAVTVHHAYFAGLLFHSLSICSMAIKVQEQYTFLSKDYLIAGALLHDIGKTKEFSGSTACTYTLDGNLIGHISLGAMMVYEKCNQLKIDEEKAKVLIHMILSHHGKLEFGSPKVPLTSEAYVLHLLDDLDSKMELMKETYSQTKDGGYSNKIPWLDNIALYKPNPLK